MGTKNFVDMTHGPFGGKIVRFALPLMLTGILQLVYNTADTVTVGRFAGTNALAAVGSTGSLVTLLLNIFVGMSMGAGVLSARCIGSGDRAALGRCVNTSLSLGLISGVLASLIGVTLSGVLLSFMNVDPAVLPLSTVYLRIYFLGSPAQMFYNFGAAVLRSSGDTKRPLYILLCTGLVNVGLNLYFVIVFGLGVVGVALATIISQYLSAIVILAIFIKNGADFGFALRKMRPYKRELLDIVKIGVPAGLQNSMFSISNVIIQSVTNSFGPEAMAGISAGSNYDAYIYVATNAFTQAGITFTSQNVGARRPDNLKTVYRKTLSFAAVIGLVLAAVGFFCRRGILGIFSEDAGVIAVGVARMALVMPFYIFCSLQDMTTGFIRGLGKSTSPMIVSVIGTCALRLAWIWLALPLNRTLTMLFIAYPLSWFVTFVMQTALYFYERKKTCAAMEERPAA